MIRHHETNEWIYTYGDAVEALSPPDQRNEYHYVCKKIDGVPQYEKYENIFWSEKNKDPKPSKTDVKNKFDELNNARLMKFVREERNRRIALTDWRFRSDLSPSQEWIDYSQALRDFPANYSPTFDIITEDNYPLVKEDNTAPWPEEPTDG